MYGDVPRAEKTTVEALDENGKKFTQGFSGLFSQIVQHEIDHLDGKLFIDKAKHVLELSKEEYEKSLKDASD
jgi:peptide deformylase